MLHSSSEPVKPLNPDTYLNRLPPVEGAGYEILRDFTFAVGGIALWDVFAYLATDIKIVRSSRFNFVIFCFIASRVFALVHIWSAAVYTAPVDITVPIRIGYIIQASFYTLSKMASSFLFLQRVLAVCHGSKWIRGGFSILWLLAFLSDITTILGGSPMFIPGTIKLRDLGVRPWTSPGFYLFFIFDTGVIVVVTYSIWLTQKEVLESRSIPWYQWLSRKGLSQLPRLILIGQVHYYMLTVGVVAMASVIMSMPAVPQVYKSFFPPCLLFLTSSMACRVFRNIKLFNTDSILIEETHPYPQQS